MSSSRAGVALVYHRVGGDGSSDPDLEILPAVSDGAFESQLRHLRRHYRVVGAADLLDAVNGRRRGRRFPVSITFDDDLPSHVRNALPALRRTGLSATFFVGGEGGPFWWEDLQRVIDDRLVDASELPHLDESDVRAALARSPRAILDLAGAIVRLDGAQRRDVAAALRQAAGPTQHDGGVDIGALSAAGNTIGFHTLRHEPMAALPDAELAEALQEGRDQLAARAGAELTLIAYPHGKADARVAGAARSAGFAGGFTAARGPITPATDPFLVPRTVADLSAADLALRLARTLLRVN